jgi:hypothetical protein
MRRLYAKQKLSEEQINRLNELEFSWENTVKRINQWDDMYQKMLEYKAKAGIFHVSMLFLVAVLFSQLALFYSF